MDPPLAFSTDWMFKHIHSSGSNDSIRFIPTGEKRKMAFAEDRSGLVYIIDWGLLSRLSRTQRVLVQTAGIKKTQ
jgi:hypothetical protein